MQGTRRTFAGKSFHFAGQMNIHFSNFAINEHNFAQLGKMISSQERYISYVWQQTYWSKFQQLSLGLFTHVHNYSAIENVKEILFWWVCSLCKKGKQSCKWHSDWKRYYMCGSKRDMLLTRTVTFFALLSQCLVPSTITLPHLSHGFQQQKVMLYGFQQQKAMLFSCSDITLWPVYGWQVVHKL